MPQDSINILNQWQQNKQNFLNQLKYAMVNESMKRASPEYKMAIDAQRNLMDYRTRMAGVNESRNQLNANKFNREVENQRELENMLETIITSGKMGGMDISKEQISALGGMKGLPYDEQSKRFGEFLSKVAAPKTEPKDTAIERMLERATPEEKKSFRKSYYKVKDIDDEIDRVVKVLQKESELLTPNEDILDLYQKRLKKLIGDKNKSMSSIQDTLNTFIEQQTKADTTIIPDTNWMFGNDKSK